ncbi:hypothetical protein GGR58DRAFT_458458 [Xylaria digitata]|nr:hypothetical protein GGR58DRAFT_458458 [Xylaria digitata]
MHLVYNCKKWAYRYDNPARNPKQVVSIARDVNSTSRSSKEVRSNIETIFNNNTDAGKA